MATASAVEPQLVRAIADARVLTDRIFAQVLPEALLDRPIPERNRILFYVGHVEAFDWNLLGSRPIDATLDQLFAFGIDPPPGQLPQDRPEDWPPVEETRRYAARVRAELDGVLESAPETFLHMALEHRLMHAETLSYMLHNLPYERRVVAGSQPIVTGPSPELEMVEIPKGTATLGKDKDEGFGWDNEFSRHSLEVPAFAISRYKITNGQFLEFVRDGGGAPYYWAEKGGDWFYRGYLGEIPLPLDWPVYVTQAQAGAYARWAGKSLPTEAQIQRAAYGTPEGSERTYPWGSEPPSAARGNFNFYSPDLVPVTATPAGDSAFGVSQLVGNGWELTRTIFAPFDGFEAHPKYAGYSANFFDGDHFVLKGGSCVTHPVLLRPSFRNWFRRHYPYAYTTFRVVED